MSTFLAIADVTAAFKFMLHSWVIEDMPDIDVIVTSLRPNQVETLNKDSGGINVYLYKVNYNANRRNDDLAMRDAKGTLIKRPLVPLDLFYLLTFYGDEEKLVPQRLLGSAISGLHTFPFLSKDTIHKANAEPTNRYLAKSQLDQQADPIKFTAVDLSLEELSKMWSVFFHTPYNLSLVYQASTLLIDGRITPPVTKEVLTRNIAVNPMETEPA